VLLLGNYVNSDQQSMQRFAAMMSRELLARYAEQLDVRLVRPPVVLGRLRKGASGLGKWLGYVDRFLLYPPLLARELRWADLIHVCDHANAVYVPMLGGKPHVVTCHDMLAVKAARGEYAEISVRATGRLLQRWILSGLRRSQSIICVSDNTMRQLQGVLQGRCPPCAVIPNGLPFDYRPVPAAQARPLLAPIMWAGDRPYFLHVGGNQWYKNREGVLRLFAALIRLPRYRRHALVMVGRPWPPRLRAARDELGLGARVTEVVDVGNAALRALYSQAEALLFPSLHEGFGWPIIEAQACGCPVVTSSRAPMADIAGAGAIAIDPERPEAAAGLVERRLRDRAPLVAQGLTNARRYDPGDMVARYVAAYRAALSGCV
jgi:glycosyltransferase involved in cell wall biosynthesis